MTVQRQERRFGGATLVLGLLLVACVVPATTLASDDPNSLVLRPVDQAGSYFDLAMRPGEARSLLVDIANVGDGAIAARTYATDAFTIVNGGYGGRLRNAPPTGTTTWVDFAMEAIQLRAGEWIRRGFTVRVPEDAGPGEYITTLVLESDTPAATTGTLSVQQINRQAIAVVITVPGPRNARLEIGAASHAIVVGKSVISIAVGNVGNVRLKPAVEFALLDGQGRQVSQATLQMDTFFAHTETFVELQLASRLKPGTYRVQLALDDVASGAHLESNSIALVVDAAAEVVVGPGVVPGLIEVIDSSGPGDLSAPPWAVLIAACLVLALCLTVPIRILRRRGPERGTR